MSEAPVMNNEVYNHFLSPAEIAEHLKDIYPEFGDLNTEELLLMQVNQIYWGYFLIVYFFSKKTHDVFCWITGKCLSVSAEQ